MPGLVGLEITLGSAERAAFKIGERKLPAGRHARRDVQQEHDVRARDRLSDAEHLIQAAITIRDHPRHKLVNPVIEYHDIARLHLSRQGMMHTGEVCRVEINPVPGFPSAISRRSCGIPQSLPAIAFNWSWANSDRTRGFRFVASKAFSPDSSRNPASIAAVAVLPAPSMPSRAINNQITRPGSHFIPFHGYGLTPISVYAVHSS